MTPDQVPVTVAGMGIAAGRELSGLLPEPHRRAVYEADILAGGKRLLACFPDAPGARLPLMAPLEGPLTRLEDAYRRGHAVTVLADGDPLFFGIGATLIRRLGGNAVRILPGVSSLQEACARLKLPWHDIYCLSLHGRDDLRPLHTVVGTGCPICLLTDTGHPPDAVGRYLFDRGVDWLRMHVFADMGGPTERHWDLSLKEAASESFGPVCTVILHPVAPPRGPRFGVSDDSLSARGGLITKGPVRAAGLALLRLLPEHVVWDVGAGSGAVALEAAALAFRGHVVAVERSPERAADIRENRRRFAATHLEVCVGEAPECLGPLPGPDRIFVGGGLSGGKGAALLAALRDHLVPGGRMVISCVLLGTLREALNIFMEAGWHAEVSSVQAACSAPLAGDIRLAALNPVFLIAAQKPGG